MRALIQTGFSDLKHKFMTQSHFKTYQSTCKIELLLSLFLTSTIRLWNSLPPNLCYTTDLNNLFAK